MAGAEYGQGWRSHFSRQLLIRHRHGDTSMHNRFFRTFVALALVVSSLAGGCSSQSEDGITRVAVSGKITLDGQPLVSGSITLSPQGSGPSAGGEITNGTYAIGVASGPSAGPYRAEIRSMVPTGRKIPNNDGAPGEMMDEIYNQIPPNFNTRSELTIEIKAGSANTHDFALTGKLPAPTPASAKKAGRSR